MVRALLLVELLVTASRPAPPPPPVSAEERAACSAERTVLERRRKVFEAEGLPPAEIARRNEPQVRALQECRERFRAEARRALERRQDLEEAARRAGPLATELERESMRREVRRERLASKPPSSLTAEERAELAADAGADAAELRRAVDEAHRRDPAFMRIVRGAIACYHGERRAELQEAIGSEERMLALESGDRQVLYRLRNDLRRTDEILAANRDAAGGLPGGLEGCEDPAVAAVSRCLRAGASDDPAPVACAPEELQQYLRLAR